MRLIEASPKSLTIAYSESIGGSNVERSIPSRFCGVQCDEKKKEVRWICTILLHTLLIHAQCDPSCEENTLQLKCTTYCCTCLSACIGYNAPRTIYIVKGFIGFGASDSYQSGVLTNDNAMYSIVQLTCPPYKLHLLSSYGAWASKSFCPWNHFTWAAAP